MNIWIFNHYAQGPELPGGTRHFDLGKQLISKGHSVTIFASGFHYTLMKDSVKYNEAGYKIDDKDGIKFVWVKTYPYQINNYKRMINIVSYAWNLNFLIPQLNLEKPSIIIGSTVHPFAPIVASRYAKKYNVPFIFEIRDLWPQTFIDMGLWNKDKLISKFFKRIEKYTVNNSNKTIVLSPLTIHYLEKEYNYSKENILLLPNGVNTNFIRSINQETKDKIDITYLGGIDKVHGLDFLVNLAKELIDEDILFNIYGDGKEKTNLEKLTKEYKLNNIIWHGSVAKIQVPFVLEKSNLLFVSTSNVLYGSENKLYEYMGSGKPLVVAAAGEHNNPIKEIGCGVSIDRNDPSLAAKQLNDFIDKQKDEFKILGKRGQDFVLKNRTIEKLGNSLNEFLQK